MCGEEALQCPARRRPAPRHVRGHALGDDAPAARAPLRAEVDHPVRVGDDVEVVLDHDDGAPGVHEPREHARELRDVGHVQPHGRFVEHVERVRRARGEGAVGADLGELGDELDALRLAPGERGRGLSEREVPEPDVLHELERVRDRGHGGEELHRLVHLHLEHVADRAALPPDVERFGVEALARARLAEHLHVGEEVHLHRAQPLARADGAGALGLVEGEAHRTVAALLCFVRRREEVADRRHHAHVGGRTRARVLADRRLVHLEHAPDGFGSLEGGEADGRERRVLKAAAEVLKENITAERGLPRPRDARHHREAPEGHRELRNREVARRDALEHEPASLGIRRAHGHAGVGERVREHAARGGVRDRGHILHRPFGHEPSAARARSRTDVDHVVGAADRLLVVLDDEERVALLRERGDGGEEHRVVARVQPDRRLIEHVAHAPQVRAELTREVDALRLAAGERRSAAPEREVVEPHFSEEREARADFGERVVRDRAAAFVKLEGAQPLGRFGRRHRADLLDGAALPEDGAGDGVEARAAAVGADHFRFVRRGGEFLGHRLALLHGAADRLREHAVARAGRAGAHFGVVGEEARVELGEASAAFGTGALERIELPLLEGAQAGRHLARGNRAQLPGVAERQGGAQDFNELPGCGVHVREPRERLDVVERIARELRHVRLDRAVLAVHAHEAHALLAQPQELLLEDALARAHDGREERDAPARRPREGARHRLGDHFGRLRGDGDAAVRAVLNAELHVDEAQEVVELRHRRDGRAHAAARRALFDRDRGRNAAHAVHVGLGRGLHHRARVGVEALEVAPLPFGEDDVEGEGGLARPRGARHHRKGVAGDVHREVLEVVLARALDHDRAPFAQQRLHRAAGPLEGREVEEVRARLVARLRTAPGGERTAREGARGRHRLGRAGEDHLAAGGAPFGAEFDHPVGASDHVEVVLDHDHRVAHGGEPVEDVHEAGDVGEVQPRRRLVEDEEPPGGAA